MNDIADETLLPRDTLAELDEVLPAETRRQLEVAGLERVLALSPYTARVFARDGGLPEWLLESDRLESVQIPDDIRERAGSLMEADDEAAFKRGLRIQRNREMVLALWRDLTGRSDLDETLAALSGLADALIGVAHDWLETGLRARHGVPRDANGELQSLVVLGLGKLGGGELNFSSDVDLIFLFPEAGETDGERSLDNEQFFTRLGRSLIRVLDEVTPDGQVYRVDMRLRPFGASGPLVMNFTGAETYYQLHGREWERYALIKARPVAGDIEAGEAMLTTLQPFIYRRYLDYSVFGSLRDMKQGIRREVRRKGLEDNIKLGRGGIREIEFVVQAYQLIRGGREPVLRNRALRPTLAATAEQGHLEPEDADRLAAAYDFLRRLENRIQGLYDAQTHDLPVDEADRRRLVAAMGETDWESLQHRVNEIRETVARAFDDVFVGPALPEENSDDNAFADIWQDRLDEASAHKLLRRTGFDNPEAATRVLVHLRDCHAVRRMGERGRRRLDRLIPSVLHLAAAKSNATDTLQRMTGVVEAIATRTAYLALLAENPQALEHLGRLCSASPWVADRISRHPLLLDELIDPRIFQQAPATGDYAEELAEHLAPAVDDLERLMDGLREFHQAAVLRIAAADISGSLDAEAVSERLTLLAEVILQRVLTIARAGMEQRHGRPRCRDDGTREAGFIIVAYGKLGSRELAYGSDLDLVFLHDSQGESQQTDGEKPLDNGVFFARLAQRIIHQLATPTPAGVLYEVDTRLRPSGSAGLLVSSLEAFEQYQQGKAWTWEHQALLRARPVAGENSLMARFGQIRETALTRPREDRELADEVRAMRTRMLEQGNVAAGDPKRESGGLVDVEFLAQYWALKHAREYPALLAETGTIGLLVALRDQGCVPEADINPLIDAARTLRTALHGRTLSGGTDVGEAGALDEVFESVRAVWARTLGTVAN